MDLETNNNLDKSAPRRRGYSSRIAICGASESQHNDLCEALAKITQVKLEIVDIATTTRPSAGVGAGPVVLIAVLRSDPEFWAMQIHEWIEKAPGASVIAAVEEHSGDAVRQALRAGAYEVIFLPSDPADLARCLIKIGEAHQRNSAGAVVCSLVSVSGGVGVSSIAAALAFALMGQQHKRVALVDLALQCGALSAILELDPEHTFAELIDPTSTIDSIRLEAVLSAHPSGLYLLAAPKRIEESELVSATTVASTLRVMSELFDVVLVDCGHHMTESLIAAWEQSRYLLYFVEQSVTSVRPAQRFLNLFERLMLKEAVDLRFILNRFDAANPFTVDKIENALKLSVAARIPRDDKAFTELQLGSADFSAVAPNSPARASIENLARQISGSTAPTNGRRAPAFFSRLRAAVGL